MCERVVVSLVTLVGKGNALVVSVVLLEQVDSHLMISATEALGVGQF